MMMYNKKSALLLSVLSVVSGKASAHLAAYAKGMYCQNGLDGNKQVLKGNDALNSNTPVTPMYQMAKKDWWFHAYNGCPNDPPADGEFLELPAGKSFTVEIASNRGKTSLSFDGQYTSEWPDGGNYPEDYHVDSCITSPNMHTQDEAHAAGTAFAIAYTSDLNQVTEDNLAVFSVRYHTPWKRLTSYDVPAAMPECPEGGCICAWGWIPDGCGQPNMYHEAFRCKVTGATSKTPIAKPQVPTFCADDPSKCVKGAKQMLYYHQAEGNNIQMDDFDKSGKPQFPGYNAKCGFGDGAQNDIFEGAPTSNGSGSSSNSSSSSQSKPASTPSSNSQPNSSPAATSNKGNNVDAAQSNPNKGLSTASHSAVDTKAQTQSTGNTTTGSDSASNSLSQNNSGSAQKCKKRSVDMRRSRARAAHYLRNSRTN